MMKKLLSFLLAVFLAFTLIGIESADMSSQTLIYDEAGLLSSNEKSKLEEEAQAIYKEHQFKSYLKIIELSATREKQKSLWEIFGIPLSKEFIIAIVVGMTVPTVV